MQQLSELEGLLKTNGKSFEEILEFLEKERTKYQATLPLQCFGFFRSSKIQIFSNEDFLKLVQLNPDEKRDNHSYKEMQFRCSYELLPEFDLSGLNGLLIFERGKLVENTRIVYKLD